MAFWSDDNLVEPLRQHRWTLEVKLGQSILLPEMALKECSLPSYEIKTSEHRLLNNTYKYPGVITWKPITLKVIDAYFSQDGEKYFGNTRVSKVLFNLDKFKFDRLSNISKEDGILVMTINQYDAYAHSSTQFKPTQTWTLKNPWVSSVENASLSYSNEDFNELTLTIQYDWAEITSKEYKADSYLADVAVSPSKTIGDRPQINFKEGSGTVTADVDEKEYKELLTKEIKGRPKIVAIKDSTTVEADLSEKELASILKQAPEVSKEKIQNELNRKASDVITVSQDVTTEPVISEKEKKKADDVGNAIKAQEKVTSKAEAARIESEKANAEAEVAKAEAQQALLIQYEEGGSLDQVSAAQEKAAIAQKKADEAAVALTEAEKAVEESKAKTKKAIDEYAKAAASSEQLPRVEIASEDTEGTVRGAANRATSLSKDEPSPPPKAPAPAAPATDSQATATEPEKKGEAKAEEPAKSDDTAAETKKDADSETKKAEEAAKKEADEKAAKEKAEAERAAAEQAAKKAAEDAKAAAEKAAKEKAAAEKAARAAREAKKREQERQKKLSDPSFNLDFPEGPKTETVNAAKTTDPKWKEDQTAKNEAQGKKTAYVIRSESWWDQRSPLQKPPDSNPADNFYKPEEKDKWSGPPLRNDTE